jgi:hypothetical protein
MREFSILQSKTDSKTIVIYRFKTGESWYELCEADMRQAKEIVSAMTAIEVARMKPAQTFASGTGITESFVKSGVTGTSNAD